MLSELYPEGTADMGKKMIEEDMSLLAYVGLASADHLGFRLLRFLGCCRVRGAGLHPTYTPKVQEPEPDKRQRLGILRFSLDW